MKRQPFIALILIAFVLTGCGREEEVPQDGPVTPPMVAPAQPADRATAESTDKAADAAESATEMLNAVDRDFAMRAFGSSIAEVQAGRLAAEKTLDEDVRQFAQEMVKDHTASNEELTKIAQTKKLELPMAPSTSFKEPLQQLTTVTGPQHDRFYMERFGVDGHKETLQIYEREIREGQDGELKRYAERWVPTLRAHLDRAEKVRAGIETTR